MTRFSEDGRVPFVVAAAAPAADAAVLVRVRVRRLLRQRIGVLGAGGLALRVRAAVAALRGERRPAPAHEAVATEVGDLEGSHLARDLPELGGEQDGCPGELERCPEGDGYEEGVVGGDGTEIAGQGT